MPRPEGADEVIAVRWYLNAAGGLEIVGITAAEMYVQRDDVIDLKRNPDGSYGEKRE